MQEPSALLAAVHLAAKKLASSNDFDKVLSEVLHICVEAVGAKGGTMYLHDPEKHTLQFRHVLPEEIATVLEFKDMPDDYGVAGQVFQTRKPVISNFEPEDEERKKISTKVGVQTRVTTMITVPLMIEGEEPIGVVQLVNKGEGQFDGEDALVLDTISAVSTMAYLNSKLLDEQTRASQLMGMGKVGHDIKNQAFALEATVSYSDDTIQSLKNDLAEINAPESVRSYADEIEWTFEELRRNINRIKSYTMLMSDLSAGKSLAPTLAVAPMAEAIRMGAAFLESEGRNKGVRLEYDIDDHAPPTAHDEMYIFRIAQNLVSNAIKAVGETNPDFGEDSALWKSVTVRYHFVDNEHVLEVVDQGPGMSEEIANRILAGTARSVWGRSSGSGWGTKIVLELATSHGGIVSIDSEIGRGSTFRVVFPHRPSV